MARGLDIDCGCFTTGTTGSMLFALVRDVIFLVAGIILALIYTRVIAPSRAVIPAETSEESDPGESEPEEAPATAQDSEPPSAS
jgi:predicted cobalt transporter CbtA